MTTASQSATWAEEHFQTSSIRVVVLHTLKSTNRPSLVPPGTCRWRPRPHDVWGQAAAAAVDRDHVGVVQRVGLERRHQVHHPTHAVRLPTTGPQCSSGRRPTKHYDRLTIANGSNTVAPAHISILKCKLCYKKFWLNWAHHEDGYN